MSGENESRLVIKVRNCTAYCSKKNIYLTLSDFYSHQCWKQKEGEVNNEGDYCRFFEERR